ncbi:MAG: nucleotidyltransferase domain-containing protein [Acidobacteriota bacterium]
MDFPLDAFCREHGLLAVYLFGSRADDGLRILESGTVSAEGSDLDLGVVFLDHAFDVLKLSDLQVAFEERFAPLEVDVVALQRVDALFQWRAIQGHRIGTGDSTRADLWELKVMRMAEEAERMQKWIEREVHGVGVT